MAVCPAKSVEASQCTSGTLQHQEVNICFTYMMRILTLFWIEEDPVCLGNTVKEEEAHRKKVRF